MLKILKNRYFLFGVICVIGFTILLGQLAYITVKMGDTYYTLSMERKSVELLLKGSRGNILDRNGIPMAMNKQIFVVELARERIPSKDEELNQLLYDIVNIIDENGDTNRLMDNIPIKMRENGQLYYIWEDKDADTQSKEFKRWKDNAGVKVDLSAAEMLKHLRNRFKIEDSMPDETARRIISIRLDIYMNRYRPNPIRVAMDVNQKTIAQIEAYSSQLPGLQVSVETGRYYPMGDVAAHIIGYVGSISTEDLEEYKSNGIDLKEAGYDPSVDRIGKRGIEKYAEMWLTANTKDKHGKMWAEVNSTGKVVRVLKEEPPEDGNNIILTLDSRLQKSVEDILGEEIQKMAEGVPPYTDDKYAPLAERGAAVVLDVNTGEVLTLASYPSFDLNMFIPSISNEDFKQILEGKGKPLTSVAFQERFAPGSVFKMMVGIAGLMEGKITLHEQIYDAYMYDKYSKGQGPRCWARPGYHGNEDFMDAIKHSCDYYFYEVADRLGIEKINEWGKRFGMDGHTGLEIEEVESSIGGPERKYYDNRFNIIYEIRHYMTAAGCFKDVDPETQDKHIQRLAELPHETTGVEIMEIIRDELGYFNEKGDKEFERQQRNKLSDLAVKIKYNVLIPYKKWNPLETVITGIGQGYVQVTPLALARYIAAVANGGKVMETHVTKAVVSPDGNIINETRPVIVNEVGADERYIEAAREGMHKVIYDRSAAGGGTGTAVSYFADIDPSITLAGKTGTAQTSGHTDAEERSRRNTAVFVAFTPYENPEIAVAVMIPNGRTASNAGQIVRRIIEEYYRIKNTQRSFESVHDVNQLKQ
jgi:penicillin-binding protein 2